MRTAIVLLAFALFTTALMSYPTGTKDNGPPGMCMVDQYDVPASPALVLTTVNVPQPATQVKAECQCPPSRGTDELSTLLDPSRYYEWQVPGHWLC